MALDGVSPVNVARMFQPSTLNVARPHPNQQSEAILKLFDAKPKSFTKLVRNHVGSALEPQLKFVV